MKLSLPQSVLGRGRLAFDGAFRGGFDPNGDFAKGAASFGSARDTGRVFRGAMATTCSGGQAGPDRADPGSERVPERLRGRGRQDMKRSLRDKWQLNVAMMGRESSANGLAVSEGFAVQVRGAADAAQRGHGRPPEALGGRPEDAQRPLESPLDLETPSVDSDGLQRRFHRIGRFFLSGRPGSPSGA